MNTTDPATDEVEPPTLGRTLATRSAPSGWWLAAATTVALLLRLHCFLYPYLWLDEYVTLWSIGGGSYREMFARSLEWTASGPLFVLIYRLSCDLVGQVEWGLKLPGVVFGVLSVPAAWWAAQKLFRNNPVTIASAWLVALAPQFIHFSQEARPYMAGAFLNILAIGCVATWFRDGGRRYLAATVLASLAAVGIHLLAALAIVAQNLFVLAYGRLERRDRKFWMEWIAAQLVLAAGLCFVGVQLRTLTGRHDSMIVDTSLPMPTRQSLDQNMWAQLQSNVTVGLIGIGVWWLARRLTALPLAEAWRHNGREVVLCGISYLVPTSLLTILSFLGIVDCWPRYYFLFATGMLFALAWLVLRPFPAHIARPAFALIAASMILQFNFIEGVPSCRLNGIWLDFSQADTELRQRIGPHDLVLSRSGLVEANHSRFLRHPTGASYLKAFLEARRGPLEATHYPLPFSPESPAATAYLTELFAGQVLNRDGFWLVNLGTADYDYAEWIENTLGNRVQKTEAIRFPALTIYRYSIEKQSEWAAVEK